LTKVADILSVQTDTSLHDGSVVLSRVELTETDDPSPEQFLSFLTDDLAQHPERLHTIDSSLVQRIRSLVDGVDVDLNTVLSPKQTPKP
jgi:antitoxin PrlF